MKEEIEDLKKEVKEIGQDSWALTIFEQLKKQNKRQFIIIIILIICWFFTGSYLVYLLNDIGVEEVTTTETEEYTQDIDDVGSIDNTNINNGGVINGKNQTGIQKNKNKNSEKKVQEITKKKKEKII